MARARNSRQQSQTCFNAYWVSSANQSYDPLVKRLFDVVAAGLGIVVLSPLLVVVASLVRIKLGGPVLFKQVRPGRDGVPFTIVKFRTMLDVDDDNGTPLPDAERLTGFGNFLRHSSLDELPELWNVLRGDMSLVGPRPLIMAYLARYSPKQARRNLMRPGITGLAQVSGRNALSWEERFELDVMYVENWTFRLDLDILARTVKSVLLRDGISAEGHVSMPEFMGTKTPLSTGSHEK